MNFEFEKLMAKVSGENTENFAKRVLSESDKHQIGFALNQMFVGLSLLEWMKHVTLANAWRASLDKMRDFVFSIDGQNYVLEYLRAAVFEHRQKMQKLFTDSLYANEYIHYPTEQFPELKKSAYEKIQNALEILKNILSNPNDTKTEKTPENIDVQILQRFNEREHNREHEHERVRK